MSPEQIYDKFFLDHPRWEIQPGAVTIDQLAEISKNLGISTSYKKTFDPRILIAEKQAPSFVGAIGLTSRVPGDGGIGWQDIFHFLLIDEIEHSHFGFQSPNTNDSWRPPSRGITWQLWVDWRIEGLILYKDLPIPPAAPPAP